MDIGDIGHTLKHMELRPQHTETQLNTHKHMKTHVNTKKHTLKIYKDCPPFLILNYNSETV